MSFICENYNSLGVSFENKDENMVRVLLSFLGCQAAGIETGIMDGIYNCPDKLNGITKRQYLYTESYIDRKVIDNLFLLLNRLCEEIVIVYAGEWNYEEIDDDNDDSNDELFGDKRLVVLNPVGMVKEQYKLSYHEIFDLGGGSNGADILFEANSPPLIDEYGERKADEGFVQELKEFALKNNHNELAIML